MATPKSAKADGAGRIMSRSKARKQISFNICRKDEDVLDESPRAYKDIDAVMAA